MVGIIAILNICSSVISVICSASVGMLRPDEMHETVEILQARGQTLRLKKCGELAEGQSRPKGSLEGMRSTIPLANREAEGREDSGQCGESDVDNDAPFVLRFVGHC